MIVKSEGIKKKILDVKYGRIKEGLGIGITDIDEYLRYKQGNFNLLIGHANTGKTTVISYVFVVCAIKHILRLLLWSSENTLQSIVKKIIELKNNKEWKEIEFFKSNYIASKNVNAWLGLFEVKK